jgi:Plasmid pRiA4b ORF-3-like protein
MSGLKFRVLLDSDLKDEVFRDIVIAGESNFEVFYQAIMKSFEFEGDQMASFYVSNSEWDKGHEINLMDMSYDDDDLDTPANIMSKAIVQDFINDSDQKFILVYDFMRMWIFLIELIEHVQESPAEPKVVLSVGNAPKEQSKETLEEDFFASGGGEYSEGNPDNSEEDEFGFNDYDDDYNEEDFNDFNEYEY